jgi:hypothetical protein
MMTMRRLAFLLCFLVVGCEGRPPQGAHRLELRKLPGDLVELVPREGNPPYCLVYSIAERGTIRQLTMNETNDSFECPAGAAIGDAKYSIPKSEGKARIFAVFTDQKLSATTVATQIGDLGTPSFSPLDLRIPGKAVSDVIEFTP